MRIFTLTLIGFFIFQCSYAQYDIDGAPMREESHPVTVPNNDFNSASFTDNCTWDNVRPLDEINAVGAGDGYPWLSPDGLRLYFTQNQGNNTLVMASRTSLDSLFGNLQPVSAGFAGENNRSCWLTDDELEIFFTVLDASNLPTLYHAERNSMSDAFSTPVEVQVIGANAGYYAGANLTPDKSQLFIYNSFGGVRTTHIFNEIGNLSYEYAGELTAANGPGELSKDGLKYYVSINDGTNTDINVSVRASLADDFDSFTPVSGTVNTLDIETQPASSGNGEIMLFVRTSNGGWSGADLYISTGVCTPVSIEEADEYSKKLTVYPNPATDELTINMGNQRANQLYIYDLHGKLVVAQSLETQESEITIDVSALEKGMYFCEVIMGAGERHMAKLVVK